MENKEAMAEMFSILSQAISMTRDAHNAGANCSRDYQTSSILFSLRLACDRAAELCKEDESDDPNFQAFKDLEEV